MSGLPYETAHAFNAALTERFLVAHAASRYSVNELRRQFAYDRLLARIFHDPDIASDWILKGGGGLLARIPDQARHSMDLDLFFEGEFVEATESLQTLGHSDLGDFFDFDVTLVQGAPTTGVRRLKVPITPVEVPGLVAPTYRVYSLVDHIADKHAAMIDTYNDGAPSTRYRDLVDLVLITNTQKPDAADLRAALQSEYAVRGITPPAGVELPDPSWIVGYEKEIESLPGVAQRTALEAIAAVGSLLDPILTDQELTGTWNPQRLIWESAA